MNIHLAVYDLQGREVAILSNRRFDAGSYSVTFNGSGLSSGVYFTRLTANSTTLTRKITLLK